MTVAELKEELERFTPEAEVVVAKSVGVAFRLLGVFGLNGKVWLDPSSDENDRVANRTSDYYEARK